VTCQGMLGVLAPRTVAAARGRRIVVAQDTTELNLPAARPIAMGLDRPGMAFRQDFSSIRYSPSKAKRRRFSVFWTPISGPVTRRSSQLLAASVRLKTRRACAGWTASSEPANC
jgi:hypothetical protein